MSTRRTFVGVVAVSLGFALASCSSGGETGCDPSSPLCGDGGGGNTPSVASVTVTSAIDTVMAIGRTATLSAVAEDANGSTVSVNFLWSSSPTSVASVNAATGVVTGVSVGTATLQAGQDNNSVTGTVRMHVVNANLAAVTAAFADAFAQSLSGALTSSPASTVSGLVSTCSSNVSSGNILAVDACLDNLSAVTSSDGNDQALLGVLSLFLDHAQRQLQL